MKNKTKLRAARLPTPSYSNSISSLSARNEMECDIIPFFDQNKSVLIEKWN